MKDTFQESGDIFRDATYLQHITVKSELPDCLKNTETDYFQFLILLFPCIFSVKTCWPQSSRPRSEIEKSVLQTSQKA